ncbi:MAG: gluconate 2-dehydrogenase subunit 3 family protein [Gemmatimonadetes bacterium]|nr:gluconate 2-dehydrogenase subunit 3 family protein [Gemmatimonadota bacterium]
MDRREVVQLLALGSLAAAFDWTPLQASRAAEGVRAARATGAQFTPKFFTAHEWETARVLVDLIIPKDERSGSATDAGVPEYMDFLMTDGSDGQRTAMRGGLAWLDIQCRKRFGKRFSECAAAERTAVLDAIAWPARATPDMSQGVAFFTSFRDLTGAGFFSSRMGVADLQYQGNTFVPEWKGCPPEALRKLGVSYDRP